jgi:hypothetical protein
VDEFLRFVTRPIVLGGFVAPMAVMIVSGLVRGARGVKLTSHADVIGVILCFDVAIIAAPDELKGLILRTRAPDDIIIQHLLLFLAGIVLWMLVLIWLEPIVLGERTPWRTPSGLSFASSSPSGFQRLIAWTGSALAAWGLVWVHILVWS